MRNEAIGDLSLTPAAGPLVELAGAMWSYPQTDARVLDLCRLRMATLLGMSPPSPKVASADEVAELAQWPTSPRFDERDRAALAFAEQWLIDASEVTDADAARVREHYTDPEVAAFTMGIAVCEALLRTELTLGLKP